MREDLRAGADAKWYVLHIFYHGKEFWNFWSLWILEKMGKGTEEEIMLYVTQYYKPASVAQHMISHDSLQIQGIVENTEYSQSETPLHQRNSTTENQSKPHKWWETMFISIY